MSRTEQRNPHTTHIDQMSTVEMIDVMNKENYNALLAVESAKNSIADAVNAASNSLSIGGRLLYIGAGTSGRLAVVDASECPPTFGVDYDTVVGIIAGGPSAMFKASEGAEDNYEQGVLDVKAININEKDTLVGISANGNAQYIVGALQYAKSIGVKTISLTCNNECKLVDIADINIVTDTGPEVITGSTRLKAGTAQKLVLNTLSTCAMVKTGKVYENLMINLKPSNKKLKHRMVTIVMEILKCSEDEATIKLENSNWVIKEAIK